MSQLDHDQLRDRAARIRLAVFDVDGVMTDGRLYYTEDGRELKAFCAQDGLGLKHAAKAGITIAVITGRDSPIVNHRMTELGVAHVYQARADKLDTFEHLIEALHLTRDQALYAGDDLVDLPILSCAGLAVTVPNAHPRVLERAHWVTPRPGGYGAVRDICDLLLEVNGKLEDLVNDYRSP